MLLIILLNKKMNFNQWNKTKCITKNFTFSVSNQRKYIENLNIFPMHFIQGFAKYRIEKDIKVILEITI